MLCRNEKEKKENKLVNYRIETCRRVLISTPLYQVGVETFVIHIESGGQIYWQVSLQSPFSWRFLKI
jgi:hypothetical protein